MSELLRTPRVLHAAWRCASIAGMSGKSIIAAHGVLVAASLAACSAASGPGEREGNEAGDQLPPAADEQRRRDARLAGQHPLPERIPRETPTPILGEAPDSLLQAIDADLAERLNITVGEARVVVAESRQWRDGSLGCPQPGRVYTQAIVPGYRVVLEYAGRQYDYRASEYGNFILCGDPAPLPPPAGVR